MMMGMSRLRRSERSRRARSTPGRSGSIQSSSTRSGSDSWMISSACAAVAARSTECPACSRFTAISSWIASSSSTTSITAAAMGDSPCLLARAAAAGSFMHRPGLSAEHLALDFLEPDVPHVGPLHDIDDVLGDVLGMVADPLDRLGDPHDLERHRDGAGVLHHEGDELA